MRSLLVCVSLLLAAGVACGTGCDPAKHFHCGEGRCIDKKYACDGNINCMSGKDERDCTVCAETAVFCEGRCAHRCDGVARCADGSDEKRCPTWPVFECRAATAGGKAETVLASKRCDGIANCDGGEDEEGCNFREDCQGGAVFCDGRCWPASVRCDRVLWCSDGADEKDCGPTA